MLPESPLPQKRSGARPKVLVFHKLSPNFSFGSTNFSPRRFARLLHFLETRDYSFGSVTEALESRSSTRPAISFDDAYEHLAEHLPALIETFQFRPIVFVPTSYIGKPACWDYSYRLRPVRHLSKEEIRALAELGVEFGSHGHTHTDLTSLDLPRLKAELALSKACLEDLIGERVRHISYPFGRFDRRVIDEAAAVGYEYGFTMRFPQAGDPSLALGRLAVYGYDSLFAVNQKVSGGIFYPVEKCKAAVTNRLAAGTLLYNRLFRRRTGDG